MKNRTVIHSILLTLLGAGFLAKADVVTDWNTVALNAIRISSNPPPRASRALAILHIAIFDAVNGVKQPHKQKYRSYLAHGHTKGKASVAGSGFCSRALGFGESFPSPTSDLRCGI